MRAGAARRAPRRSSRRLPRQAGAASPSMAAAKKEGQRMPAARAQAKRRAQ
jgi:hypothetical protein